jgi:hypothetical protein
LNLLATDSILDDNPACYIVNQEKRVIDYKWSF